MRPQQKIYRSAIIDSARWAAYNHRPGDIFVCASPKCGTTWMQTIVASLLWPEGNFPGAVHKGIKGQPPMRFDSLSHEALLQRHERAAFSTKQEPWTVLTPQRVATSIEPATGHPRP
jgi:hypothetical protein